MDTENQTASHYHSVLEAFISPKPAQVPAATVIDNTLQSDKRTYYRSKAFTSRVGTNPLVAAASPLLSLIFSLRETSAVKDIHALYQHLAHEVRAFETESKKAGYREETILIARYILCSHLDETLGRTVAGTQWQSYSMLHLFHRETWGGERFFVILDRIIHEPGLHIDLLELMYFCLSSGFEGKYAKPVENRPQLEIITHNLYHCIRLHRGSFKTRLLIGKTSRPRLKMLFLQEAFSLVRTSLLTGTLLLGLYAGFSYLLSVSTSSSYQTLNQLIPLVQDNKVSTYGVS